MTTKQSLVATSTRDFNRTAEKIRNCLIGYPEGLNPKAIAAKTGLNVNTVKSTLPKIKGVTKKMRGIYKVAKTGDTPPSFHVELEDWNFHNLILSYNILQPIDGVVLSLPVSLTYNFGLVKLDFSISQFGKASLRVSSDWPLNVSSICFVGGMFITMCGDYCHDSIDFSRLMVSTVEFNRDYKNLRLDGVQSISLDSLVEQFKVYQKKRGLRVEHKTKVPLSVDSIVDMLSNNPNSVDLHVKLNEQKSTLERLSVAMERSNVLQLRMLDVIARSES